MSLKDEPINLVIAPEIWVCWLVYSEPINIHDDLQMDSKGIEEVLHQKVVYILPEDAQFLRS